MNKSEKCYYAIIQNKKREKFSGASPIEVAKKVASKKLKSGKEMEFYLDEVGGKKKRYGPYHARKDKKSGKVAVVKEKKVMKGGILSGIYKSILNTIILSQQVELPDKEFLNKTLPFIPFGGEPILYLLPDTQKYLLPDTQKYLFAVFKLPRFSLLKKKQSDSYRIMDIYIFVKNCQFPFFNFNDFFLNNQNLDYIPVLQQKNYIPVLQQKRAYLLNLLYLIKNNAQSKIIKDEANKIVKFLDNSDKNLVMIYVPDYTTPLQLKCVYKDFKCGMVIFNYIPQRTCFAYYEDQIFLVIYTESNKNNPIIYIRVSKEKKDFRFKYCINTSNQTINLLYEGSFNIYECSIINIIPSEFGVKFGVNGIKLYSLVINEYIRQELLDYYIFYK